MKDLDKYWFRGPYFCSPIIGVQSTGTYRTIYGDLYYIKYHGQYYKYCGSYGETDDYDILYDVVCYKKVNINEDPEAKYAVIVREE